MAISISRAYASPTVRIAWVVMLGASILPDILRREKERAEHLAAHTENISAVE